MCGIAGIFHYAEPERPVDRDLLVRMTTVLSHRGPDGDGIFISGNLGLGHRRLAIVDLSPTGSQPMANEDGSCWIAYNGEFYNHESFRRRLVALGHRFRGPSDTETLVHVLEQFGAPALSEIAGIFGFGFWNGRCRRLTLARDALGVKQVYYHDNGRRIVFASEIKALLVCADVPREPDSEGINQYLHFHTSLFERTFFRDIRQVRAGEYLEIGRYGMQARKFWCVKEFSRVGREPEVAINDLREQLAEVVKDQLMSDVPVGAFFSGGIDSSAVACYASRAGRAPKCFGVHFSGQGVVDERPYQEEASRALGLELQLITLDGGAFPDDLRKLLYHQDQPVIGSAMFPMFYVSRLASSQVRVCLGGQGADEIFGGYGRYALVRPWQVGRSWFSGRSAGHGGGAPQASVSGNIWRQASDSRTIYRLARNVRNILDWERGYFENFAKVAEASWAQVFQMPSYYSRDRCWELFHESIGRSEATDPADKIMHWDSQTYLTGLFHQDDRMSMAVGLESRVPLADPRLVSFAFRIGFDLKFRAGASKWILRRAVSDVLPKVVLTRRKVGFDTPAERWMKELHFGFVQEVLLSSRARQRGLWNDKGVRDLLAKQSSPYWSDMVWKILCIEMWSSIFLDGQLDRASVPSGAYSVLGCTDTTERSEVPKSIPRGLREVLQEGRELGVEKTVARGLWEIKTVSGLAKMLDGSVKSKRKIKGDFRAIFSQPPAVAEGVRGLLSEERLARLSFEASEATRGRIKCFGKWMADFGNPIDWHRNPLTGTRWRADVHWSMALRGKAQTGDIKLIWEAGRFPQVYTMARCATFLPESKADLGSAFVMQVQKFLKSNPPHRGIHWNSGQEISLRLMAWMFGLNVFEYYRELPDQLCDDVSEHILLCGRHIAAHIQYVRDCVYNNHLLSEAMGLYLVGRMLPDYEKSQAWAALGRDLLECEANKQFYADGSYIQQSHNYHRFAIQIYLWALSFAKAYCDPVPSAWIGAIERSLDFLIAHQNPGDGRLPNYGANDGSAPLPLSTCDFSDFRPTLQAASIMSRQERIYDRGPWDEMAVWFNGPSALDLPLRKPSRTSISFQHSGYYVLRGREEENFAAFRCGSILDRFSQFDMLGLDVWWRGHNVLADAGTYLYNGPENWHRHFACTESHNTVQVDGLDQMLSYRRFKYLYWTKAKLLRFEDTPQWVVSEGEHYGYQRHAGQCVHRRSVLFLKDDVWIVVDRILGSGTHRARVHWLGGDFPFRGDSDGRANLRLETPAGPFYISIFGISGHLLSGDVVAGVCDPPRGWLSRYYAEKVPVPSLAVEVSEPLPITLVSVLSPVIPKVSVEGSAWSVSAGDHVVNFELTSNGFAEPRSSSLSRLK